MIRSFIFDIGNVLIPFDYNKAVRRIAAKSGIPFQDLPAEAKQLTQVYEAGQIDRPEFLKRAFALLDFQGTKADFVAAWEDIFVENFAMTKLVNLLRERYPLYLLSNTNDIHSEYFETQYPVFQSFTGAVYSYRVGCIKPGREIFEIAIRQFNVDPSEVVYIDDLAANIATACEFGLQAFHYDHTRHECLLQFLDELKIEGIRD